MLLEQISTPDDLKKLNPASYPVLCDEIRQTLLKNILRTGGHLASNLGVVELTVALHLAFFCPKDKIVFDVGHQSYVHKLLTGRYQAFSTIRQSGGLSGFPKPDESEYDAFVAGHASTSISAALGLARARDLCGEQFDVIAFIGDGALGGGMAYEAMNDAGISKTKLLVVLNDNEMSIEKNVGGMSEYLSKLRSTQKYIHTREGIANFLERFGAPGRGIRNAISKVKDIFKYSTMAGSIFENLGFTYLGIIDGHDINGLVDVFRRAKNLSGPVLIHTFTKKGMGYLDAEENPGKYHGVKSKMTVVTKNALDYSSALGTELVAVAKENPAVVAVTAAMTSGCGLTGFAQKFPARFFDVGIAEQHAVTMAAGMAAGHMVPVVCIYSTFLQRAYDQLIHDVCLQNLHVVFCVDRAGVVGEDGETHQGVFDLSYLTHMPNMTVLAPSNYKELAQMLRYAVNVHDGPIAIRYPRGAISFDDRKNDFVPGKCEVAKPGSDATIAAVGRMVDHALCAANILAKKGIDIEVLNIRCVKPFDKAAVLASANKTKRLYILEDNLKNGGFGSFFMQNCPVPKDVRVTCLGWGDAFIPHAKVRELFARFGLDGEGIAKAIEQDRTGDEACE